MKKQYFKLKIKVLITVIAIMTVGIIVVTYNKARDIQKEYMSFFQLGLNNSLEDYVDDESKLIRKVYEGYSYKDTTMDNIGYYSMLKDRKGNILAEYQMFLIIIKGNEIINKDDTRILLLGDGFSNYGSISIVTGLGSLSQLQIEGTCDDVYIYPESVTIANYFGTHKYTDFSTKNYLKKDCIRFEEWVGTNVYNSKDASYNIKFTPFVTDYMVSEALERQTYSKLDLEAKEICGKVYNDVIAKGENTSDIIRDNNLFTSSITHLQYVGDKYVIPEVYVCHPINMAIERLLDVYMLIVVLGVVSLTYLYYIISNLESDYKLYELNRRRLTSGIAHELKTPVAIIRGYVENWDQYDENERNEYSKTLIKETDHMSKLVGDFLELSRLEAKAKKLNLESVDLYSLTNSVLNRMQADVRVETDGLEEYLVQADLEMIRTAISNLVSNSIKYSDKMIELKLSENNGKIKFLIANDGATIDGENMGNVWDEFYKGNKNDYNRFGSDGLGLAITKNIFILHKAQYGCTSKNGRTEFWFELKKDKEE
ncbi:MAG: HAMP domain-containing histidine kinase [Lachnospiraceae bacterium]|nr:HAMP domain-containing histidine kinase [Lachnospiraceae bacterium]